MNVELSTWQRAGLIQALGAMRGNVATLRLALGALEAVEFTEEEREEIEYVEVQGQATWNEAGAKRTWEIELGEKEAQFTAGVVERFEQWPVAKAEEVFALIELLKAKQVADDKAKS